MPSGIGFLFAFSFKQKKQKKNYFFIIYIKCFCAHKPITSEISLYSNLCWLKKKREKIKHKKKTRRKKGKKNHSKNELNCISIKIASIGNLYLIYGLALDTVSAIWSNGIVGIEAGVYVADWN